MKHLSKIITAATVAALTLGCVSAFAMGDKPNAGQEVTQTNVEEKNTDRRKPELTEEEKAARVEKAKAKLAEKLAEGKITQEEYDEALAKIESGDFKPDHRGGKGHSKHKPHDKAADETKENESTVE